MKASTARAIANIAERRDLYQDALRLITPAADCPVHETYSLHLRLKVGPEGIYVNIATPMIQQALREAIRGFEAQIEELKNGA